MLNSIISLLTLLSLGSCLKFGHSSEIKGLGLEDHFAFAKSLYIEDERANGLKDTITKISESCKIVGMDYNYYRRNAVGEEDERIDSLGFKEFNYVLVNEYRSKDALDSEDNLGIAKEYLKDFNLLKWFELHYPRYDMYHVNGSSSARTVGNIVKSGDPVAFHLFMHKGSDRSAFINLFCIKQKSGDGNALYDYLLKNKKLMIIDFLVKNGSIDNFFDENFAINSLSHLEKERKKPHGKRKDKAKKTKRKNSKAPAIDPNAPFAIFAAPLPDDDVVSVASSFSFSSVGSFISTLSRSRSTESEFYDEISIERPSSFLARTFGFEHNIRDVEEAIRKEGDPLTVKKLEADLEALHRSAALLNEIISSRDSEAPEKTIAYSKYDDEEWDRSDNDSYSRPLSGPQAEFLLLRESTRQKERFLDGFLNKVNCPSIGILLGRIEDKVMEKIISDNQISDYHKWLESGKSGKAPRGGKIYDSKVDSLKNDALEEILFPRMEYDAKFNCNNDYFSDIILYDEVDEDIASNLYSSIGRDKICENRDAHSRMFFNTLRFYMINKHVLEQKDSK